MITERTVKCKQRPIDSKRLTQARLQGLPEWIAAIVAARPLVFRPEGQLGIQVPLAELPAPSQLPDCAKGTERLLQALQNQEVIALETDHDCDGQTSHAVLWHALVNAFGHPVEKTLSFIGERLTEGYGLSDKLVDRILAHPIRPTLVITADNGSSDELRIARLAVEGIDVIVTDHHEIAVTGIPKSAIAVINPIRPDSLYPDQTIAGCMVAWLWMAAVKQALQVAGKTVSFNLAELLDFVAVGTVADCVSMARSGVNRAVVRYGMQKIAQGTRPCWRVLKPHLHTPLQSEDLGFLIGPLLNSDGRLATAMKSVSFLLSETDTEAQSWLEYLQTQNQSRKSIQKEMTQLGMAQAEELLTQYTYTLCPFLEEGHSGVHGICASRLKDHFGMPVIYFAPKRENPTILTGSARSIDDFHMKAALEAVAEQDPTLLLSYGGHQGAAGLSLYRDRLEDFRQAFEHYASLHIPVANLGPCYWHDGAVPVGLDLAQWEKMVQALEPFGREFDVPSFYCYGQVRQLYTLGSSGLHARICLQTQTGPVWCLWFNKPTVQVGDVVEGILRVQVDTYQNEKKLAFILNWGRLCTEMHPRTISA